MQATQDFAATDLEAGDFLLEQEEATRAEMEETSLEEPAKLGEGPFGRIVDDRQHRILCRRRVTIHQVEYVALVLSHNRRVRLGRKIAD